MVALSFGMIGFIITVGLYFLLYLFRILISIWISLAWGYVLFFLIAYYHVIQVNAWGIFWLGFTCSLLFHRKVIDERSEP